jgi:hypothetical protein
MERLFAFPQNSEAPPLSPDDLSGLSMETVDRLLSSESLSVESEDALLNFLLRLGPAYSPLLRHIRPGFLSVGGACVLADLLIDPPEWAWPSVADWLVSPPSGFVSQIISRFPAILGTFSAKHFSLLWRRGSDPLGTAGFHGHCDGHAPTLTVISDMDGNIFGGFTPVAWNSDTCVHMPDESLKSFLFTLKNPHNLRPKRFGLKADKQSRAIRGYSDYGPYFGNDICLYAKPDKDTKDRTCLGASYVNDTRLPWTTVFTGAEHFTVKEIEVFEIADSAPKPVLLPACPPAPQNEKPLIVGPAPRPLSPPLPPLHPPSLPPSQPAGPPDGFDSQIVSDFPDILAEFGSRRFVLLWRGSRDGFRFADFHRRCDRHAPTLTLILDKDGNVFGGFRPVEWDFVFIENANDGLESFIFTLRNPHKIAARRFGPKPEGRDKPVKSSCGKRPVDGLCFGSDICVSDNCHTNSKSSSFLGDSYTNDTKVPGKKFFTGSASFRVKEIEVFEIAG